MIDPDKIHLVDLDSIDDTERVRQDMRDIEGLADSINRYADALPTTAGLIHPVLLNSDNKLVAGGRRVAAHRLLNRKKVAAVYADELDEATLRELEAEENLERFAMTWQENVMAVYNVHTIRQKQAIQNRDTWTQRQTGRLLRRSQAHVSNTLVIAERLLAGDEEIVAAQDLSTAIAILAKRKEDEASKKLAAMVVNTGPTNLTEAERSATGIEIVDLDIDLDLDNDTASSSEPTKITAAPSVFDISRAFHLGDCIKVMSSFDAGSFDHVVTDIPYGIDMSNLEMADINRVEAEHQVDDNVELMKEFIPAAYRVLRDNGYLVFWYDLDHHEKLMALGKAAGFKVQRWPLVWCKTHNCRNNSPQYNWTKATEVAMVMRKSANTTLIAPQLLNYFMSDGSVERRLYNNPFAKPADAWNFILSAIAIPGQTILDPFGGEMSCPRACLNNGLQFVTIELKEHHMNNGVNMIREQLTEITNDNIKFTGTYTIHN